MTTLAKPNMKLALGAGAAFVLLAAMALDTRVVRIGSDADAVPGSFSAAVYGRTEYPKVQQAIESRAVDVTVLAAAIAKDQAAAEKQYGIAADAGPEFAVRFVGKAGSQDSGVYDVAVPGLPDPVHVSVQTGPAITGTDLRDGAGTISFGQFSNQIDYQNAGSALNKEMKKDVLSKVDVANLTGKQVSVVGVFQLTDPGSWVVTPVKLDVR